MKYLLILFLIFAFSVPANCQNANDAFLDSQLKQLSHAVIKAGTQNANNRYFTLHTSELIT